MPPGMNGGMNRGGRFMTEEEKKQAPKVTKALVKRVFSYLKPYTVQLIIVVFCIIVSSLLSTMPSILTGKIIDEGLIKQDMRS
ncbi:MAG: ABC transporter ATP-binding protein, partial [Clostridiales bacterium]|nr:ABC transporter ATP-binding protein [Clostridiales bacterium]